MLEKMDDFFAARVDGYDEHMKSREKISQWINDGKLYRKIFLFKRRWEIYCEKKIFYSGYGWHCVSVLGFL